MSQGKNAKGKAADYRNSAGQFDVYAAYSATVQDPDGDALFLRNVYHEIRGVSPKVLREDFCAAFALSCAWVKLNASYEAAGIDLEKQALDYGRENHLPQLTRAQQKRVSLHQRNVLDLRLPSADVICALNFSHYIFKDRAVMSRYFRRCHASLKPKGIFAACCFGGPGRQRPNVDRWKLDGYTYYFEQENFDFITNFAKFHIHFKPDGGKKIERAFSYDWRMWSIPEMRELLREAGFSRTHVYWEEFAEDGSAAGHYTRRETGEDCESWIAYVVGEK